MNLQTEARPRKFRPTTRAEWLDIFPQPALDGPTSPSCGDVDFDRWNAYWRGREAVAMFLDFPRAFARGVVEELRRRDVPFLTALVAFNNAVLAAVRAMRRTTKQHAAGVEVAP